MNVRRKQDIHTAIRWDVSSNDPDVEVVSPKIVIGASEKHFYLSALGPGGANANSWLPIPGKAPDDDELPFAFYEMRVGHERLAERGDPLTELALKRMGLAELPSAYGLLMPERIVVNPGDWIVTERGERRRFSTEEFAARFDVIEDERDDAKADPARNEP